MNPEAQGVIQAEREEVKRGIEWKGRKTWEEKGEDVVECAGTEGLVRPSRKCTLTTETRSIGADEESRSPLQLHDLIKMFKAIYYMVIPFLEFSAANCEKIVPIDFNWSYRLSVHLEIGRRPAARSRVKSRVGCGSCWHASLEISKSMTVS